MHCVWGKAGYQVGRGPDPSAGSGPRGPEAFLPVPETVFLWAPPPSSDLEPAAWQETAASHAAQGRYLLKEHHKKIRHKHHNLHNADLDIGTSFTFLHNPPWSKQRVMQRQRGIFGVQGVIRTQPGDYWLHGDVGKTKRSRSKRVGDAWVHVWIVALIGGHQLGQGSLTKHSWQIMLPG